MRFVRRARGGKVGRNFIADPERTQCPAYREPEFGSKLLATANVTWPAQACTRRVEHKLAQTEGVAALCNGYNRDTSEKFQGIK